MKHNILLCAATLLALAGCAKEIKGGDPAYGVEKTFTAYVQGAEGTKTYLTAEHRVWWLQEDAISVFAGGQNSKFTVSSLKSGGAQAEFSGITPEAGMYYALYPYQKDASFAKDRFTATLPSQQTVTSSSFDPAAALSVCKTDSQTLKFRNVGSIVSILTGNEGVTSIRLTGKGASLSGKAEISFKDDAIEANVTEGTDYVELSGAFETNTEYFFAVLPGKFEGFELKFVRNDGKNVTISTDTGANIGSNGYFTLGSFTFTEDEWEKGSMKDFDSFILDGYDQVQAFLDDTVEERINVRDLIITGSDVTSAQLLALKNKVLSVRGTFSLSGVLADEWENSADKNVYLETEQIIYNPRTNGGQNGIRLEGSIIFEDIPCNINPNGLGGVTVCGGDLIIRNIGWPFDWNGQDNLTSVRGDLIVEGVTKTLSNFHFPKLSNVGGSLVVNDCDHGFWEFKDFPEGLAIGGDLIITGNEVAFEYVEWMQGLLKISSIGGNVTIFDNRMNADPARYCVVRDMYRKGIIRPDAVITLGTTWSGTVDFKDVPSCDGEDPEPEPDPDPSDPDSYTLDGYDQVQAFLDDTVEERINVKDLIITGSDVTSAQLLALKNKVLSVSGTFKLSGVLADEWENSADKSVHLETEHIICNSRIDNGKNGIRLEGSIIFEDIPCNINPNGLSGVTDCGGDLIIRNIGWPFDWNGQDNLTSVRGDLIIEGNTKTLSNFHFPKLSSVGGSIVVNDCDNGFWEFKDFPEGLAIGGDLIITGNENAFEYVEWMQGLLKISSIGGNVTIFDNRMNADPARYCVVRDMYRKGIIKPDAVITLGTTWSGVVDFNDVPSCNEN